LASKCARTKNPNHMKKYFFMELIAPEETNAFASSAAILLSSSSQSHKCQHKSHLQRH
jgi:hypothetical protein